MFESLLRRIRQLEKGVTIRVPISPDAEGFIERECPACEFQFKVMDDDWATLFRDDGVFCPLCGHEAEAQSWFTKQQIEHGKREAYKFAEGAIQEGLRESAAAFNRRQPKTGFVRLSMAVRGAPVGPMIPAPAGQPLEQRIQCRECKARFAVIGGAFFCPCCGYNSALETFETSLRTIRAKLGSVAEIRKLYVNEGLRDNGELIARNLVESSLGDCVSAHQALATKLYEGLPCVKPPARNVFQRLDDGDQLWRSAVGAGYADWLGDGELAFLRLMFQRRHLLEHTQGIVDDDYLRRSGDKTYKLGQRIVIRESEVLRILEGIERLGVEMRAAAASNSR